MSEHMRNLTTDESGESIYPITDDILNKIVGKGLWTLMYSEEADDIYYRWYINIQHLNPDGTIAWDGIPAYYVDDVPDMRGEYPSEYYYQNDSDPLDDWKIYLPLDFYTEEEITEMVDANDSAYQRLCEERGDNDWDDYI